MKFGITLILMQKFWVINLHLLIKYYMNEKYTKIKSCEKSHFPQKESILSYIQYVDFLQWINFFNQR